MKIGDAFQRNKQFVKTATICLSAFAAGGVSARFVDPKIENAKPVQVSCETVAGKAASLLPPGKKWKLVWHDEFDGREIDKTKWMCRESFWGYDFPAFAHDFEGVEMTGETMRLNLVRKGDDFVSPHLQTGSLTYDIPRDTSGFWPFGKRRQPFFMKKYGYFEIRCRQPKFPGWHSAFWLQAPGVGSHPDAGVCGVETDIMENYSQFTKGTMVGGNGWGGYGKNGCWYDHFQWKHEETADGWHNYGCDWNAEGYTFYCDGKKIGEQNFPVSHVEQFVLVSTECGGYRKVGNDGGLSASRKTKDWGKPDPRLFDAKLPDFFEVDYVRVYDEIPAPEPVVPEHPADDALRTWVDAAWTRVMSTFYSPKTGNIYATTPDKVSPASDFPNGLLKKELGYGRGLEDCAINGGVALSGLVDKWLVTKDKTVRDDAEKVARGLLNLATAHPYKGFVARGLCVEDGKSICNLSSRDQVTHWYHGLYRFYASELASDKFKAEIRAAFVDVADRMARNVTRANDWNFLQADGSPDPRGVCKMRETYPHEAARLAMIYALTCCVTGDKRWEKLYYELRDEALVGSCSLGTAPDSVVKNLMPDYTLIQMNTSLEAILAFERGEKYRAKAIGAMVTCARLARERAPKIGSKDTRYLCGCAEVHLAQMMVPAGAFKYGDYQRALLANAIVHVPADKVGAIRACHLFAAYWRLKRLAQ